MEPFKLQYRPPAWELTASFNREFDDVSPPFVRFDGHKTSLQIFNEAKGMRASYGSEPSTNVSRLCELLIIMMMSESAIVFRDISPVPP